MDTTGPPHWSQDIADGPKFGGKIGSIVRRTWLRMLDDTVVVGTAVLPNMLVSIAVVAAQVRRKFGEQGDDVAAVLPSPKYDNISFGHRASP
jgi:hypothetical protein